MEALGTNFILIPIILLFWKLWIVCLSYRVLKCDTGDIVKEFKAANAVLSLQWVEYDGEDAVRKGIF